MIRFENVSFRYPGGAQVKALNFELNKGDFAVLVGANGAGKSTVSKLCNGLLKPQEGHVFVKGQDTRSVPPSTLAKDVGFLFQNPDRQICQPTVEKEIGFGLQFAISDEAARAARCREVLDAFGFEGDRVPFSMSRGERQRIALASVIAARPDILILDEPTTGLNYQECVRIMSLLCELNAGGTTILMITHDMELVQDYAQRVLVLCEGELIGDGPVYTVMRDEALLARAALLPAQIPGLALRLGQGFEQINTVQEMAAELERRCG